MSKKIITNNDNIVLKIIPVNDVPNGVDIFSNDDPIFDNLSMQDFVDEFMNRTMKLEGGELIKIEPILEPEKQKIKDENSINKQIRKLYTEHEERLILMKGIEDPTDADYMKYKNDILAIVPNGGGK